MLLREGFPPFNVDVLYGCTECSFRRTRSQAWRLWKTKIDTEVSRFAWQISRLLSLNHGFSFGHYLIGFIGSHLSLTDYIARAKCGIFACCRQMLQTFGGPSVLILIFMTPPSKVEPRVWTALPFLSLQRLCWAAKDPGTGSSLCWNCSILDTPAPFLAAFWPGSMSLVASGDPVRCFSLGACPLDWIV